MALGTKTRISLKVGCAIVVIAILIAGTGFPVCFERGYICENTGSRKGYTEWFYILKTGQWYKPTAVEEFMQQRYPHELQHRWTSYNGTGKNIWGRNVLFAHGSPGPVLMLSGSDSLNGWFERQSDTDKRAFYTLLSSGDQTAIRQKVESIMSDPDNYKPRR